MRYVLFPGRHHLLTRYQAEYLARVADGAQIVFAVTSADHGNTRRNPIPGHRREAQIERLSAQTGLDCRSACPPSASV